MVMEGWGDEGQNKGGDKSTCLELSHWVKVKMGMGNM